MDTSSYLPVINNIQPYLQKTAIIDESGTYTYENLWISAQHIASTLLKDAQHLNEARVNFLITPGFEYTATLWGIWLAGGIAVPMCISHPPAEWAYVLSDTQCSFIIADDVYYPQIESLATQKQISLLRFSDTQSSLIQTLPNIDLSQRALIIYTSGTTGKPKGVVTTHQNIRAQIHTLVDAWKWSSEDYILHTLPLHHVHGIINVLCCALWSGAVCEFMTRFDAEKVWQKFIDKPFSLYMAVPTIYNRLIEVYDKASPEMQQTMQKASQKMRLMVSGSAALPVMVLNKWQTISGHVLLERYGMTEIGMALSNPYDGERLVGYVGKPLLGVDVRLVDEQNQEVPQGEPGQIQIKSSSVFKEYWQKPETTVEAFTDGWFLTGDIAIQNEQGYYKILGRNSVDIIKTGGYKVSALEVEEVLRTHPYIQECAVVGITDEEWGEKISAAINPTPNTMLNIKDLRVWAKQQMAGYKIPQQILVVTELPRNAMGKVVKPEVKKLFE